MFKLIISKCVYLDIKGIYRIDVVTEWCLYQTYRNVLCRYILYLFVGLYVCVGFKTPIFTNETLKLTTG